MAAPQWQPGDKLLRRVSGGLLVQDVDTAVQGDWQVVTTRTPTDAETRALAFAWRVVKFVKSNAIVLAMADRTTGIGAGQMNRVGAARIAIEQAGALAAGSVLASDAFFPMRDTVDTAAAAGIRAIIQPGGSLKDADSIAAANEHGIAMVFTGQRHFLHYGSRRAGACLTHHLREKSAFASAALDEVHEALFLIRKHNSNYKRWESPPRSEVHPYFRIRRERQELRGIPAKCLCQSCGIAVGATRFTAFCHWISRCS